MHKLKLRSVDTGRILKEEEYESLRLLDDISDMYMDKKRSCYVYLGKDDKWRIEFVRMKVSVYGEGIVYDLYFNMREARVRV
ncbi:hypothetical protein ACIQXQ_20230 [Peribacillus sp. NPDC097198]|uniref:hypothetical protein n=1 Tax=Peribacillus sp. NPDC097198 TaxID=3364397 RepID=UPI003828E7F5